MSHSPEPTKDTKDVSNAVEKETSSRAMSETEGSTPSNNEVAAKQETAANPPPMDFPEGGLVGWATVLGAFLVQFCGFGYSASFGVYQAYYTTVYITNETASTISWIGGVNASMSIFIGLISGRLFDKGYFYHMVWGGAALDIVCLWLLTLAKPDSFYQNFLAQGLGCGIAQGMMYLPCIAVVSHYFRQRRALAMTIVASGSSMGSIIQPIMLNNLLNTNGFKTAAVANAAMLSGILVIACALMRTRLPPPERLMGFGEAVRKFMKDGAYVMGCLGLIIFSIGYYYPLFYIQLDAEKHGLSSHINFYVLVILNVFSFLGRLSPGFLANKVGVPNLITMGMFGCSVVMLGMIGAKSVGSFIVIAILYGYCAGTFISLANPLLAGFATDQMEVGARMGIGFTLSGIGALVGGSIEGALLTSEYVWWKPAVFSGVFALAGVALMVIMLIMIYERKKAKARASAAAADASEKA
ncbi:MFS general substrate transporter [Lentinula raphanica]|uniref:MFS general substrate transporter n=1 Tax=Lentinula raphanica TaxID=153919 RepID=A0AA38UB06_9AGAR|nr:MFS general substrate transporter [Lentinula raphanica]KAJ3767252.1 MFS general substrate transporter [Lentinula raphanica]KAJ3827121.1 MFS general substrate transporter [Lentinula raphanica]KAJ3835335.1 MFS general substrate transporter [Lentinula raphanica]